MRENGAVRSLVKGLPGKGPIKPLLGRKRSIGGPLHHPLPGANKGMDDSSRMLVEIKDIA
jgi:hypothetical protein